MPNDLPLSKAEIAAWVDALGKSDQQRISCLKQLLKYRVGDRMTPEDEVICRAELQRLLDKNVGQTSNHKKVGTGNAQRTQQGTGHRVVGTQKSAGATPAIKA